MNRMNCEKVDHFFRHMKSHREEMIEGSLKKGPEYLENLKDVKEKGQEIIDDLVHEFGWRDIKVDLNSTENIESHQFRDFDYDSFREAIKMENALNMGLTINSSNSSLLKINVENLCNAVEDANVLINLLEEYFK